jgi:hypothetical protein
VAAYYLEFRGRDLPLHAQHAAEKHGIDAAAPPDVGGLAAAYYENDCSSVSPEELTAENRSISLEQLLSERDQLDCEAQ